MRIETYSPRWHSAVIELADKVFGEGYFANPWELSAGPDSIMLVAQEANATLLGFAQGQVLPRRALQAHLDNQVRDIPEEIAQADATGALGVIEAVAVSPDQRRKGTGKALLLVLHDRLIGHGADKLIVTFKRGRSAAQVAGLMRDLEFEEWIRLPSYWKAACDSGEFHCIDRRNGCACEALLYRKSVY